MRREIEEGTAARLAEILAVAERAAKQVIDEAEAEARARLAAASGEADRIVAARLAELSALTDEVDAQAVALRSQAEALRQALARVKVELQDGATAEASNMGRREGDPPARKPSSPALTVVEGAAAVPAVEAPAATYADKADAAAGARLLATQMAVSGSSRAEIEARLRDGFELADAGAILDAILGPDQ